jgi:hypothetical protein
MMAYLVMMAARFEELYRVLSLQAALSPLRSDCEPLSEARDGCGLRAANFQNEIIWKRTNVEAPPVDGLGSMMCCCITRSQKDFSSHV